MVVLAFLWLLTMLSWMDLVGRDRARAQAIEIIRDRHQEYVIQHEVECQALQERVRKLTLRVETLERGR
jgi:hypothetical protein